MSKKQKLDDEFGQRMKAYEFTETSRKFDVHLPVYARIDGRSFSKFTKGMARPFDVRMSKAMVDTTKFLIEQTNAVIGYVQSDEISLIWLAEKENSDIFFSGKTQKMCSVLASMAAAKFNNLDYLDTKGKFPHFDCRVLQLPSKTETANMFLWRAMDCYKNAISMVAQWQFSHKKLLNKGRAEMIKMLEDKYYTGYFEEFPDFFKYGTFIRRILEERYPTLEELEKIPEQYRPEGKVKRHFMSNFSVPNFNKIINREKFIFENESPKYKESESYENNV